MVTNIRTRQNEWRYHLVYDDHQSFKGCAKGDRVRIRFRMYKLSLLPTAVFQVQHVHTHLHKLGLNSYLFLITVFSDYSADDNSSMQEKWKK